MKNMWFGLVLCGLAMGLSGCFGLSKKVAKKPAAGKKVTQKSDKGVPLASHQKGDKRFWDDNVEAFVLEEDDTFHRYGATAAKKTGALSKDTKTAELAWSEEANGPHAFEKIYFDFDRYEIRKDQEPVLAYNTEEAKKAIQDGKLIKVEGHSDKHCLSETYNMAVSQKRAYTVAQRLEKSGIGKEAIKPLGYGDAKVVVDVQGKEPLNRRVELVPLTA